MHGSAPQRLTLGETPRLAVVLVHGRGRTAGEMADLARAIAVEDVRYVFPVADEQSWYPKGFMAGIEDNQPDLDAAIAAYERIVAGLVADGFPPERIVLGGFLQGACLTAEYLARHPRRYGGALILTGGLIGPAGTVWPERPELAGMPAYLTGAEVDEWVPVARVRETADWLARSGAVVETVIVPERPQTVGEPEIAAARALVTAARDA